MPAEPLSALTPRSLAAVAGRLSVFLVLGAAAGVAANTVPYENGWLWCIGAFLPVGPILAMLLGARLRWPEIHPTWFRGSLATALLVFSLPWATGGFWLGLVAAKDLFHAGLNAALLSGFTLGAVFTVVLVYVALGIVTGEWSARIAGELAIAAALTLLIVQSFVRREQYVLFPVGMGLMSVVMGWYLLRPGVVAGSRAQPPVRSR